jgi:hypothetical protein
LAVDEDILHEQIRPPQSQENIMNPEWKWSKKYHAWRTQISLSRLGAWRCLWNVLPGEVYDAEPDEDDDPDRSLDVLAATPEEVKRPDAPSPAQTAALARLFADDEALEQALAQYLFDVMREGQLGCIIPEPGDAENDDQLRQYQHLHRPEAMQELLRLVGIEIMPDDEEGLAHVVLNFDSAFDDEHGLSVCVHGTQVLSHGGLGDQGGWPPPSEEDLAQMAAMFGSAGPRDERQLRRQALESALADPVNSEEIRLLTRAALALVDDPHQQVEITVRIDTPPVTRIEKVYYGQAGTLSYDLTIAVGLNYVIYKDSNTPRQAGLQGAPWPLSLFAAQCKWPAARPRWDTVEVRQIDTMASLRKNKRTGPERPELRAAAEAALREGFDPTRLAQRGWRLPPDPLDIDAAPEPSPREQALGAGMMQGLQALRGMLTGERTGPPPDLASLIAGVSGDAGPMGALARMMSSACQLMPVPAEAWAWCDQARGQAAEAAFDREGLQLAGRFQVLLPFTPGFAAYADPGRRFYALVANDIYQRTVSLECLSLYDDGGVFAMTTRAASTAAPVPPWRRVEVLPADTAPGEVVKKFLARRPADGLRPVAAENFSADFQAIWQRETEWRANQGT